MNAKAKAVLSEFAHREASEREAFASFDNDTYLRERDRLLLGIGPETGQLLNLLIRAMRPRNILEVGTSFGYSTLWLAEAAACVGAHVTSLDIAPEKQTYAARMMSKAGLREHVTFVVGDAIALIGGIDYAVDFALIDLWKELYIPVASALWPKLANHAILCADNMLFPEYQKDAAEQYIKHVRQLPGAESLTISVGSGVELTVFTSANQHSHPSPSEGSG